MQTDIRLLYAHATEHSHAGRPELVRTERSGSRGRPRLVIDADFLRWAVTVRSTSGIARFLNVSRQTVRSSLLDYGLAEPQGYPFSNDGDNISDPLSAETTEISEPSGSSAAPVEDDDLLDPPLPHNIHLRIPPEVQRVQSRQTSENSITDNELDTMVTALRLQFPRAGRSILYGAFRSAGVRIPQERIRLSLLRIDPVHRIFQRITIQRRTYSVPGPNALWHHDGQHGMFSLGSIVLHCTFKINDVFDRSYTLAHCHSWLY